MGRLRKEEEMRERTEQESEGSEQRIQEDFTRPFTPVVKGNSSPVR